MLVRTLVLTALVLVSAAAPCRAFDATVTARCPDYPVHLRAARTALARGQDRTAAAELRRAREALEACLRERTAGQIMLAALAPTDDPA